jgi:hypothetical protein
MNFWRNQQARLEFLVLATHWIGGVMDSILSYCVKPKTIKLVFAGPLLNTQH